MLAPAESAECTFTMYAAAPGVYRVTGIMVTDLQTRQSLEMDPGVDIFIDADTDSDAQTAVVDLGALPVA